MVTKRGLSSLFAKAGTFQSRKVTTLLIFLALAILKRAVISPFRGQEGAPTYRRDVLYSGLRELMEKANTEQGQYVFPPTNTAYKQVCRKRGCKPDIVDIGSGAQGLWIGMKDAKHIILYFHGMNDIL